MERQAAEPLRRHLAARQPARRAPQPGGAAAVRRRGTAGGAGHRRGGARGRRSAGGIRARRIDRGLCGGLAAPPCARRGLAGRAARRPPVVGQGPRRSPPDRPLRRGHARWPGAGGVAGLRARSRLCSADGRAGGAGHGLPRDRAVRLRARDQLWPAVRRGVGREPDQPCLYRPGARQPHGQSLSRSRAAAAAAALLGGRGRRRRVRSRSTASSQPTACGASIPTILRCSRAMPCRSAMSSRARSTSAAPRR